MLNPQILSRANFYVNNSGFSYACAIVQRLWVFMASLTRDLSSCADGGVQSERMQHLLLQVTADWCTRWVVQFHHDLCHMVAGLMREYVLPAATPCSTELTSS